MNMKKSAKTANRGFGYLGCVLAAVILVLLQLVSCTRKPPELSVSITPAIPEEVVDLTAVADIDWYLLTSKNEASLKEGKIIPFDRKAGADYIRNVRPLLPGNKQLAFTGLVDYRWSDGEKMQNLPPIAPALMILFGAAGEASGFDFSIDLPKNDLFLVVHGACEGVSANIVATVRDKIDTHALRCQGENTVERQYWTYQVHVKHGAGETLELNINSVDAVSGLPSLTVGGVLLATQPIAP